MWRDTRLRRLPGGGPRTELGRRQILPASSFAATVLLFIGVSAQLETGFGGQAVADLFTNWLYDGVGFAAALTCAIRGVRKGEGAWLWIAAGVLAWTAGDVYYTFALQSLQSPPSPSFADLGYLGFYVPVFVGLGLLVRRSVLDFGGVVWLDGLIGGFTVCALATALVLGAVWSASTGAFAAVATNLAYPAGDALLLALIFCVLGISGWKLTPVWVLLGGGLLVFAVADSVYLVEVAHDSYHYGTWLDLGWPAGFVSIAAGSLTPSLHRARARLDGMRLLVAPVVMALICLAIEVWDHFQRVETVALVSASLGLLAVIGRLAFTFEEYLGLLQLTRTESLTDALTGLGNRRALIRRLDEHFAEPAGESLLLLFDLDGFKAYNDTFGHGAGDALLQRLGRRLRDTVGERGCVFRLGGDEFCILVEGGGIDLPWVRAATSASLRESGEAFTITCSSGHALLPHEAGSTNEALQIADRRMYAEKGLGIGGGHESRGVLLQALAERDESLGQHMSGVAEYSAALAAELGLVGAETKLVRAAAELHDVGKLALPETILQKPGQLDEDEWKIVQQHTLIGERIIAAAEGLENVAVIVRSTHERWDGTGYPDRLRGTEIPLAARVIAICDAYDAITSNRPYRAARTREEAVAELRASAGTQFDPGLVEAFVRRALPGLTRRIASNGRAVGVGR